MCPNFVIDVSEFGSEFLQSLHKEWPSCIQIDVATEPDISHCLDGLGRLKLLVRQMHFGKLVKLPSKLYIVCFEKCKIL